MSRQVTAPHVYRAINAITAALSITGIAKSRINPQDQYTYRSIDDVLGRLAPLLARHRLCVLPRVMRRETIDRAGDGNSVLISVHVMVAFDLVSARDGSRHTVRASGEAADASDKATAKALSAAYKTAMLQTFCVPVSGSVEAEDDSHRFRKPAAEREPVEGWEAWTTSIVEMIGICETGEALGRVSSRQAAILRSLSRERAELYRSIGDAFTARLEALSKASTQPLRPASDLELKAAPMRSKAKKPDKVDA